MRTTMMMSESGDDDGDCDAGGYRLQGANKSKRGERR